MKTYYELDHENFVMGTGDDWDDFADANNGEGAKEKHVISRPIWDFVDGDETASFLNAIFFWCRHNDAEFSTKYRCDSEHEARLFAMHVTPRENRYLRVTSKLLSTTQTGLYMVPSIKQKVQGARCSMCGHFETNNQWIDPFAMPGKTYFPKSHVICPNCKLAALQAMGQGSVSTPVAHALVGSTSS